MSADPRAKTRLQCMELRGGSGAVDEALQLPGIDCWIVSRPFHADDAGGDVHYLSTCATGRIARVLLADVSGHGADVGVVAGELHDLMARYVNFIDQRRLFRSLNHRLSQMLEGGMFATAVVLTYFAPTHRMSISNAGHPPPLIWRQGDRAWSVLKQGATVRQNLPLGVIDASRYDRFDLTLHAGDCVLCFTDGLTESRDSAGELLGSDAFLDIVGAIPGDTPEDVIPRLMIALRELYATNLTQDDLTLLLFRPNGGAERVPWSDRLRAPWRVLRGTLRALQNRRPRTAPIPEFSVANLGGAIADPLSGGHDA